MTLTLMLKIAVLILGTYLAAVALEVTTSWISAPSSPGAGLGLVLTAVIVLLYGYLINYTLFQWKPKSRSSKPTFPPGSNSDA